MTLAGSPDSLAAHRNPREERRPGDGGVCTISSEGISCPSKAGSQLVHWMRMGEELEISGAKGQQETALSWRKGECSLYMLGSL